MFLRFGAGGWSPLDHKIRGLQHNVMTGHDMTSTKGVRFGPPPPFSHCMLRFCVAAGRREGVGGRDGGWHDLASPVVVRSFVPRVVRAVSAIDVGEDSGTPPKVTLVVPCNCHWFIEE